MPTRAVLTYPNPLLKKVSDTVGDITSEIESVIKDLVDTLESSPGCVGIAAPQIGALHRIIVIDGSRNRKPIENHGRRVLINPLIEMQSGSEIGREGCLSLPDFTANVARATAIRCTALDASRAPVVIETHGFEARLILHEIDHLDGILFLDRVSCLKTDVFRRKSTRALSEHH